MSENLTYSGPARQGIRRKDRDIQGRHRQESGTGKSLRRKFDSGNPLHSDRREAVNDSRLPRQSPLPERDRHNTSRQIETNKEDD